MLFNDFRPKINVHAIRWDACNLPFKDDTVDVFITDLVGLN